MLCRVVELTGNNPKWGVLAFVTGERLLTQPVSLVSFITVLNLADACIR
jgi:hypothetical protein